jgi:hypothetical protein
VTKITKFKKNNSLAEALVVYLLRDKEEKDGNKLIQIFFKVMYQYAPQAKLSKS